MYKQTLVNVLSYSAQTCSFGYFKTCLLCLYLSVSPHVYGQFCINAVVRVILSDISLFFFLRFIQQPLHSQYRHICTCVHIAGLLSLVIQAADERIAGIRRAEQPAAARSRQKVLPCWTAAPVEHHARWAGLAGSDTPRLQCCHWSERNYRWRQVRTGCWRTSPSASGMLLWQLLCCRSQCVNVFCQSWLVNHLVQVVQTAATVHMHPVLHVIYAFQNVHIFSTCFVKQKP